MSRPGPPAAGAAEPGGPGYFGAGAAWPRRWRATASFSFHQRPHSSFSWRRSFFVSPHHDARVAPRDGGEGLARRRLDEVLLVLEGLDSSSPDFTSHYGQSFLYLTYFLDRFGKEATRALTNNPENDLPSVDETLAELNITDPGTGKVITADDVFMDWAATLYLQDGSVGDGRYTYNNYSDAPQYQPSDTIRNCPQSVSGQVNQYGIDYYSIDCEGDYTLAFTGSTVTRLLPIDAHSGSYVFWSNRGDESNMTLTREFDFTNVSGPIDLSFSMWHDLATDYNYLFLEPPTMVARPGKS